MVLRALVMGVVLANLAGCYGLGYSYPGYGYSYGYPRYGYGYPYGFGYYGGYGYGPYYQYGYGGGRRYSNTQLWNAYQWQRNNPGGLSPGQMHWLRHHR